MKVENKIGNNFCDFEELKEVREIYINSLYPADKEIFQLKFPSLIYAIYNKKLSKTFIKRINELKADITKIIGKLNNYKGPKIDATEEKLKLDEIINKLNSLEKQENDDYEYYLDFLVGVAKRSDTLKNEEAKNVYIKTSEDIIKMRMEYYMKHEKNFLLFNDNINKLKNIFNI